MVPRAAGCGDLLTDKVSADTKVGVDISSFVRDGMLYFEADVELEKEDTANPIPQDVLDAVSDCLETAVSVEGHPDPGFPIHSYMFLSVPATKQD